MGPRFSRTGGVRGSTPLGPLENFLVRVVFDLELSDFGRKSQQSPWGPKCFASPSGLEVLLVSFRGLAGSANGESDGVTA